MRILVVSNLYHPVAVGGYEAECHLVVELLRPRHDVVVLTSRHRRHQVAPESHVIRRLPFLRERRSDSLRAPLAAIAAARTVLRLVRRFRPDVLYVWNGTHIPQVAIRVLEERGIPVAYRVSEHWFSGLHRDDQFIRHLFPGDRGLRRVWGCLVRAVNRLPCLRIDVESRPRVGVAWISQTLRRLTEPPDTVRLVVDEVVYPTTDKFECLAGRQPRRPDRPTVAFVGRISIEKGADVAYRALADLHRRHHVPARLLVAGASVGRIPHELARLAHELGIEEAVEVLGQLDAPRLADLYSRAHALVIPSRWEEPFGLVTLEAALARLPVVASHSGAIPEILRDGEEALFFPIGDHEACADALAAVIRDPKSAEERATRAHRRALEFSPERAAVKAEEFLRLTVDACGVTR